MLGRADKQTRKGEERSVPCASARLAYVSAIGDGSVSEGHRTDPGADTYSRSKSDGRRPSCTASAASPEWSECLFQALAQGAGKARAVLAGTVGEQVSLRLKEVALQEFESSLTYLPFITY